MDRNYSVVFAGVGGQGVILASDLLAEVSLLHGFDVKKAEVHGMAQRGGSVVTYVKMGPQVYSPLIDHHSADILCSFEPLEAIRYVEYVRQDGVIVFNASRNYPLTAIFGKTPYPENPAELLRQRASTVFELDALKIALELKIPNVVNVILIGAISSLLPFSEEEWFAAIERKVKPKFVDINKEAFRRGRDAARLPVPQA